MPGFGVHVCSWPEEAEVVAAEKIKEASKKRLLGNIFPARESWYRRKCLSRVYFMSPLVILACLAMLKTKILPAIKLHAYVSTFKATTCITESSNLTELMLPCDCRASSKAPECVKEYPCFQLSVTIKTHKGLKMTTYMYEDMEALSLKYENCAVLNRQCKKTDPGHTVESLASHYGDPGSSFSCLFNPHEPSEVILHVAPLKNSFWAMLVFVCLLMLLSVAAPIIAYLTCGCMYVCTRSPPPDIQAEVDQRAGGGAETAPEPEEEPPAVSNEPSPQPQQQPLIQQPVMQQLPMMPPQYQPLLPAGSSPYPPPYNSTMAMPVPYQTLSPQQALVPAPVPPVYGSPILGAGSRAGSPQYLSPIPGSPMPPPVILYVHPGGVISLHPPSGTTPVTFQPDAPPSPLPPSPVPSPTLIHAENERREASNNMFYQ